MRVFVISLPKTVERRAHARAELSAAGVAFGFFDALTADQAVDGGVFDRIDRRNFLLNTGRELTPGEIGCFASHRELWKRALQLGEPLMIMEDDFTLAAHFADALAYADEIIGAVGFLRLQKSSRARRRRISRSGNLDLAVYTKPPHCMMCYCIAPDVARNFVERTQVLDAPVDVFVKKYWEHGQPLYAITPYSVLPSSLSSATTIDGRVKAGKPIDVAVQRFLRKCGWELRRTIFNLDLRLS